MTKCPDEIELERYIAGLLRKKEVQQIEGHVASCSVCLGRLDRARADEAFLAKLREVHEKRLPDDVLGRLQHRSFETLSRQGSDTGHGRGTSGLTGQ